MTVSISEIMNGCKHLDLESCKGICTSDLHNSHCCRCGKHLTICETCGGSGELSTDERDRDGNWQRGVGSEPCPDCNVRDDDDYNGDE